MIDTRSRAAVEREPRKEQALAAVDLESSSARFDELSAQVSTIEQQRQVEGLARPDEAAALAKLQSIETRLAAMPAGAQHDALAERARLLRGTLLWQLDADYKHRLTSLQHELRATGTELAEARHRVDLVKAAGEQAPLDTAGFAARIGELSHRIVAIQPRLDAAAVAQERVLADLAVAELRAQKRRLGSYASQAQFALAALYDHAASGGGR
jgi:hypothetical protein